MLGARDPIDWSPRRILVAGVTGAGKTTYARRLAAIAGYPYVETDSLYHGTGWTERPTFLADLRSFIAQPTWVTEWQYRQVREETALAADTLIWLDHPTPVALIRVIRRTVRRRRGREVLWNGNVEPPLRTFFTDPDHIVRWGIRTRNKERARVPDFDARMPHLRVVRLRNQRDADRWAQAFGASIAPPNRRSRPT